MRTLLKRKWGRREENEADENEYVWKLKVKRKIWTQRKWEKESDIICMFSENELIAFLWGEDADENEYVKNRNRK